MFNQLLTLGTDFLQGKPLVLRSGKWETVRKHFLEQYPRCAACNRSDHLQIHHCVPFHLDSALELEPSNLITLCEGEGTNNDHFVIGHFKNWKTFNPNVREDAKNYPKKY